MNIYIYDIEVFAYDWIVVARRPEEGSPYTVIHNDNYHLRKFLNNAPDILGGFNNKHYDDYVVMVMINGGDPIEVKRCNDFIIGGGKPWEYSFIQYKKKPFKSFDLRDDIADPGISLKAIEGNLKLPIVESSVPFDIDRPLTPEELEEVIRYCKYDVDSTVRLYWERKKNYLDAKILAGSIYGIDPLDALGYTNARLSAEALKATYTERSDERDYMLPANLDPERIPKIVLDFFLQIRDKTIPDAKLFGAGKGSKGMTLDLILKCSGGECPVSYAWGGVHGAKPCVIIEETEDRVIINQDVGSLYPNSMINFGYTSRSMADPDAYRKLVELDGKVEPPIYYKLQASLYAYLLGFDNVVMTCSFLQDKDYQDPEAFVPTVDNTVVVEFKVSEEYPTFKESYIDPAMKFWRENVLTGISPEFDEKKDAEILKVLRTKKIELPKTTPKKKVNYVKDFETDQYIYNSNMIIPGHGDKSVMMLLEYFALTKEEVACIRWHMGAYETDTKLWDYYGKAIKKYPNVLYTHTADMIASKILGGLIIEWTTGKELTMDQRKLNASGCKDITAFKALENVTKERKDRARLDKLLATIFYISDLAGFRIEGRITFQDKKTGKIWR